MEKRYKIVILSVFSVSAAILFSGCTASEKAFITNATYRYTLPHSEGMVDFRFKDDHTFIILDSVNTWMDPAQEQTGHWKIKKGKLYVSTDFQRRIDDFVSPIGICGKDSIIIYTYSMKSQEPSSDFAIFHHNIIPDTINCRLSVPCEKKDILEKYIGYAINEVNGNPYVGNVMLQCGKTYKMYIMDCFMSVYDKFEFEIMENKIIATETGWIFKRQ